MQSTERKIRQFIKATLLSESVFADDPAAREKLVKLNKEP